MTQTIFASSALTSPDDRTRSASEVGRELSDSMVAVRTHMRDSMTFGEPLKIALRNLRELRDETALENWDGYGAPALSWDVFDYSVQFLQTLPPEIPQPEIGSASNGDISFEWAQTPYRLVSVAISSNGEVHFAALNGQKKTFGSFPFDGTFDASLRTLISTVLG